ncbi:MAG: hypothetical protein E7657_01345 [Ruminococcaceae bacterium]|nr:hypothetical protein [Oscillospiraceae bacterium]
MKKGFIRLLSLALALVLICVGMVSCNDGKKEGALLGRQPQSFNDIYKSDLKRDTADGYTFYEEITLSAVAGTTSGEYGFLRYREKGTGNFCVYNVESDRTVLSVPASSVNSIEDVVLQDGYIVVLKKDSEKTSTLVYDEAGEFLASTDGVHIVSAFDQGFQLGDKLYYMKDGKVSKTYTVPPFLSLNQSNCVFTDKYLVRLTGSSVIYYNEKFEEVACYEMPRAGCVNADTWVLSGGKVLFMGIHAVEPMEKDFDYYYATSYSGANYKAKMHYELYDPETNTVKELSFGFAVANVMRAKDSLDYLQEGVDNVLSYYVIKDGVIDRSVAHYVTLDNDANPVFSLDSFVDGQRGMIAPLEGSGNYYVSTNTGYTVLSPSGEILKELPSVGTVKDYGYYWDQKIYNNDFNLVKDLSGYNVHYSYVDVSGAIMYWKQKGNESQYFIYNKAGENQIIAPEGYSVLMVELLSGYYKVTLENQKTYAPRYNFHAFDGECLLSVERSVTVLSEGDSAMLVRYYNDEGEVVYGRFAR